MDETVLRFVRLALAIIADRLLTILGLTMSFVLACWTMNQPTIERLGMAAFFAGFAYLIVKVKERNDNERSSS